jgi:acyl carrier protein
VNDIAERVRQFFIDDLGWEGTADQLTDDLPLIHEGVLDSLGILNLVTFLESAYGIDIEDSEIVPANLGTIGSIGRYVLAKKASAVSQPTAQR